MARVTLPEPIVQRSNESKVYLLDLGPLLRTGETLTGTPTVTISPSGPTIGSASVNSEAVTEGALTVAASEGIQFRFSGGTAGSSYTFDASCGSSDSNTHGVGGTFTITN